MTNVDHYEDGTPTGLWLGELVHVWDQLEEAGVKQVIGSPAGGKSPIEPKSLGKLMSDKAVRAREDDAEFMARLDNTVALRDVDWQDYDAIYLTAATASCMTSPPAWPCRG